MNRRQSIHRASQRSKRRRQNEKHRTKVLTFVRSLLSKPVSWLGFLGTIVTLFGGWYAFKSNIDIIYGALLDRNNPYSTPFTLSNRGLLSLHNIDWEVELVDVDYMPPNVTIQKFTVRNTQKIPFLDPGQTTTRFIPVPGPTGPVDLTALSAQIRTMEIVCSVSYQDILSLREKRSFRFLCVLNKDGNYEWLPYDSATTPDARPNLSPPKAHF